MVRDGDPAPPAAGRGAAGLALALAALGLAACARPDGSAPALVPPFAAAEIASKASRQDLRIEAATGSIVVSRWMPEGEAKAIVLAVHGYGDYGSSTFDAAARDWTRRGILTYAYDQRGFGRNPSNGDWPGHRAIVDDLVAMAAFVRAQHPETPLVLVGHSMGGAVIAVALGEGLVEADRAVLLAPAFWGGRHLNPLLRAMAFAALALAPEKRWTGDGIVEIQASDNLDMLRALGRDPLYVRAPSSRDFAGLIRLMDRAVAAAPAVATPVLVVYGARDEVLPEEPIREAYARFSGPKRYRKVETGWHMLLRDLEAAEVRSLVAEFALGGDTPS